MSNKQYTLLWRGRITGPYTYEQIDQMLATRRISLSHQIKDGGDFVSVADFVKSKKVEAAEAKAAADAKAVEAKTQADHARQKELLELEAAAYLSKATAAPQPHRASPRRNEASYGSNLSETGGTKNICYAGFWIRVCAYIIDCIIIFFILIIIGVVAESGGARISEGVALVIGHITFWLYTAGLHSSEYKATLGKRLLYLEVVDANMKQISFGRATGRYFAEFLSAIFLFAGYLVVLFRKNRQGLHDQLASTYVVIVPRTNA